jgi:hypothetical protein
MTDLEQQLRAAMHAAVDGEEAAPETLIAAVRRRYRRHNVVMTALVVLVAIAAAIPVTIAVRSLVSEPGPSMTRHHANTLPGMMTGQPMPPGTNIPIISMSNGADWYFTASKHTEHITGQPASVPEGYSSPDRVQGGWVLSGTRIHSFCPTYFCAGPPYPYYFVADGSVRATHLGSGIANWGVRPSSHPGSVWLISHVHSSDNLATTSATAQLVSTAGRPLSPGYRLPAGYLVLRGVGPYLLLEQWPNINPAKPPRSAPPISFLLWNPSTGKIASRLSDVLLAGPEQIVLSPSCRDCRMQILDVATGRTVTTSVTGPQATAAQDWNMSDDGSLLAMQPANGDVAVLSTASGTLARIAGTNLNFNSWMTLQWQAGSHELLIFAGPGRGPDSNPPRWVQFGYWRPGTTGLRLTTVHDKAEIYAIGTG